MLVGPATKQASELLLDEKSYQAEISFGTRTTTDDAEGEILESSEVPAQVFDEGFARSVLADFVGEHDQVPPDFSALKREGKVGYREARKGTPLALEPRRVEVFSAELLSIDAERQTWSVEFSVSKGTYIRALARDIGIAASTHAHLSKLRRLSSGDFRLEDAYTIDDLTQACASDPLALADCFVSGARLGPAVVSIGVFDGVHEGHQSLLRAVNECARREGLLSVVITFDVLPEEVLTPQRAPQRLMNLDDKVAALKACDIDEVIVLPFTQALAQQSTEFFLLKTLPSLVQAQAIVVGENFRCGARGEGTPGRVQDILNSESESGQTGSKIPVYVNKLLTNDEGIPYSSTLIRAQQGTKHV